MINIEGANKLHDLYRLFWFIVPLIGSFVLGFLLSFYVDENNIFQNGDHITLTCNNTEPQIIILPIKLMKTGS